MDLIVASLILIILMSIRDKVLLQHLYRCSKTLHVHITICDCTKTDNIINSVRTVSL